MKKYIHPETTVMDFQAKDAILFTSIEKDEETTVNMDDAWSRDEREGFNWD